MSSYKAWITSTSLLSMVLVATLSAQPAQPVRVPASLTQMGEYGENIYDAAKAQTWKEADAKLAALKQTIQRASPQFSKAENEQLKLQREIAALAGAVRKRDSWTSMREANQVTLVAAEGKEQLWGFTLTLSHSRMLMESLAVDQELGT